MAALLHCDVPVTTDEKRNMLLSNGIALWDVIASCDISGSSDSTITNVVPNDISSIIESADIKCIFLNGKTAEKYYNKYIISNIGINAMCLPSTSPANAAWSVEKLVSEWQMIIKFLKK